MYKNLKTKACNFVIFGATGDLAKKKIFPSLYFLEKSNLIHPNTRIIGVSKSKFDINYFIQFVYKYINIFTKKNIDKSIWKKFSNRLYYCNIDIKKKDKFIKIINKLNTKVNIILNYLAVPPKIFQDILIGLEKYNLNNYKNNIIIEKPIGYNLISSKIINNTISKKFNENQIYRIDHYLAKDTILNLFALRFANSIFTLNWNNRSIDHVQITVSETLGIEGRWDYFDQIGQMRDMIQSHLLQILSIITMSTPKEFTNSSIKYEKIKILKSLRSINYKNFKKYTVRGQYISGFINGKKVPGYLEENNFNKNSFTETFVAIKVYIDNLQWAGVPFYLRTGKRLKKKYSEIVIYFKNPIINFFKNIYKNLPKNKLIIRLQPNEGIDIIIMNKIPCLKNKYKLKKTKLELNFKDCFNQKRIINAYERIILEAMAEIKNSLVSQNEIEIAWKWVDSIIESWNMNKNTIQFYKAGTWGPTDSINLIKKDGRSWNKLD